MSADLCPHCGQSMPIRRLGVEMSALKARIVDMVERGGADGYEINEIYKTIFRDRDASPAALKTHVAQINELIESEGYRIVGVREHNRHMRYDRYRLERRRAAAG